MCLPHGTRRANQAQWPLARISARRAHDRGERTNPEYPPTLGPWDSHVGGLTLPTRSAHEVPGASITLSFRKVAWRSAGRGAVFGYGGQVAP